MWGFGHLVEHLEPRYQLPNLHFISDMAVPPKYKEVCKFISKRLENTDMVSLITDIWSSTVCPMSLLSLPAQWVDSSFMLQKAVLQAKQLHGSHTGESIATEIGGTLDAWKIVSKVCVISRDNDSNVINAMDHFGVASLGCFTHTLQLL